MAVKKYKKLTNAEKKMNKEIKEDLRAKGIIPPVKPKLNRKKFAKEVNEESKENLSTYGDAFYIFEAINWMKPSVREKNISLEQIGVLKVLKIAIEIKRFQEEKKNKGETQYSVGELYDAIAPILNL